MGIQAVNHLGRDEIAPKCFTVDCQLKSKIQSPVKVQVQRTSAGGGNHLLRLFPFSQNVKFINNTKPPLKQHLNKQVEFFWSFKGPNSFEAPPGSYTRTSFLWATQAAEEQSSLLRTILEDDC